MGVRVGIAALTLARTITIHQRAAAETVLRQLQQHPEAWTRVDAILEKSSSQQSKYFALQVHCTYQLMIHGYSPTTQILEDVIKHRWGALPDDQREGIKNYISNLIIKLATASEAFRSEKVDTACQHCLHQHVYASPTLGVPEQAQPHPGGDPQAGLAAQVAKLHPRHRGCQQDQRIAV